MTALVSVTARMRAALKRLGEQDTDPDVWDDLAAENEALAPARARANRALLGDGKDADDD